MEVYDDSCKSVPQMEMVDRKISMADKCLQYTQIGLNVKPR